MFTHSFVRTPRRRPRARSLPPSFKSVPTRASLLEQASQLARIGDSEGDAECAPSGALMLAAERAPVSGALMLATSERVPVPGTLDMSAKCAPDGTLRETT